MFPLFSPMCDLVGWVEPDEHIFDPSMQWVAYIAHGHAWSSATNNWLGPVHGLTCLDHHGHPVAWNDEDGPDGQMAAIKPLSPLRPLTPLKPLKPFSPLKPLRPLTPLGGWSKLTFSAWLRQ